MLFFKKTHTKNQIVDVFFENKTIKNSDFCKKRVFWLSIRLPSLPGLFSSGDVSAKHTAWLSKNNPKLADMENVKAMVYRRLGGLDPGTDHKFAGDHIATQIAKGSLAAERLKSSGMIAKQTTYKYATECLADLRSHKWPTLEGTFAYLDNTEGKVFNLKELNSIFTSGGNFQKNLASLARLKRWPLEVLKFNLEGMKVVFDQQISKKRPTLQELVDFAEEQGYEGSSDLVHIILEAMTNKTGFTIHPEIFDQYRDDSLVLGGIDMCLQALDMHNITIPFLLRKFQSEGTFKTQLDSYRSVYLDQGPQAESALTSPAIMFFGGGDPGDKKNKKKLKIPRGDKLLKKLKDLDGKSFGKKLYAQGAPELRGHKAVCPFWEQGNCAHKNRDQCPYGAHAKGAGFKSEALKLADSLAQVSDFTWGVFFVPLYQTQLRKPLL